MRVKWAYGVTTVPQRFDKLLPDTLASLKLGGFDKPRLFIDSMINPEEHAKCKAYYKLEVTCRSPRVGVFGNWVLSIWELYLRDPTADRYVIFQDDIVVCRNLRQYLNTYRYVDSIYWNLYNMPVNEALRPSDDTGWYDSSQSGLGALALVLSRPALVTLLQSPYFTAYPQDCHKGTRSIDGAVAVSFKNIGWKERVHYPSLVQHVGMQTSMVHVKKKPNPPSESFRGENFDAMELIKGRV